MEKQKRFDVKGQEIAEQLVRAYQIYDRGGQSFHMAFPANNQRFAERILMDHLMQPESRVHQYPNEFELYETGTFSDLTGKINYHSEFIYITSGTELNERSKNAQTDSRQPEPEKIQQKLRQAEINKH